MKTYFDTCTLNRPLDDHSQLRVTLEAEALLKMLEMCRAGKMSYTSSDVLFLENRKNYNPRRRAFVGSILRSAQSRVSLNGAIHERARELEKRGFKAMDALHLACAESAKVDYFCTCDDRLLKKARVQKDLGVKVLAPLELAGELSI